MPPPHPNKQQQKRSSVLGSSVRPIFFCFFSLQKNYLMVDRYENFDWCILFETSKLAIKNAPIKIFIFVNHQKFFCEEKKQKKIGRTLEPKTDVMYTGGVGRKSARAQSLRTEPLNTQSISQSEHTHTHRHTDTQTDRFSCKRHLRCR